MLIGGQWRGAAGNATYTVKNPATGEVVGTVADGSVADARAAIEAAAAAFPAWSKMPAEKRSELLYRAWTLMVERTDRLARILTLENGKPLAESRGEVGAAASYLQWAAEEAKRIYGRTIPGNVENRRLMAIKQPVGVVAAITPWNFPSSMITRKAAPALAAGCTVVLRPASQTPYSAIELFKIFHEVGIPAGVVNIITGKDSAGIGKELATNPLVRKITFTGSTEVGKQLMALAASTVKRVSMELGGHAPFLVFADADLDLAARGAVQSKYRNAGQTCICTNRLYVERSVADVFAAKLSDIVGALKIGNGLQDGVQIGPLIDERAREKVQDQVEDAVAKGAKLLVGGKRLDSGEYANGFFYQPTVVNGATREMKVVTEETFGPLLPIIPFDTEEEAIRLANDSNYGLAAYFYTNDLGRSWRVAEALEYGIVGVNDPLPTDAKLPFGGVKESGMGRENGAEAIEAFLETKAVAIMI
ncbi:MAG: NAD-dependent succinate-semialdehyde dehydrogenase [Chloroflexi bacterium]|nr:NAD-dependent succinate-semialdehyde dehydrogenase [Chloroflexota bacterium]